MAGSMGHLREKLLYIQNNLKAPKNQYNKYGNYFYRNCEDIQDAVKPLLAEKKCILVMKDQLEFIGEDHYIKATAFLFDCESGEEIENSAYAKENSSVKGMSSAQVTGSTSSYARKYALNGLFCISDEKDNDTNELKEEQEKKKKEALTEENKAKGSVTQKQISDLRKMFKESGIDESKVLVMCKVDTIEQMTYALYRNVMNHKESVKGTCSV